MIDRARRQFTHALAIGLSAPLLHACGGGSGASDGTPQRSDGTFGVYPSANDARVLDGLTSTGEKFVIYGERNAAGKFTSVDEFHFLETGIDEQRALVNGARLLTSSEGVQVALSRNGKSGLLFGLTVGGQQLELELPSFFGQASLAGHSLAESSSRIGKPLEVSVLTSDCACVVPQAGESRESLSALTHAPIVEVEVAGCTGDNPTVQVILRDEAGKFLDTVTGRKIGPTRYACVMKDTNSSEASRAEAAQAAIDALKEFDITGGALQSMWEGLLSKGADGVANDLVARLEDGQRLQDVAKDLSPYAGITPADVTAAQRRVALRNFFGRILKPALKAADVFGKVHAALLAGNVLGKAIDAYSQYQFNRLQIQPRVILNNGTKVLGQSSGLLLPQGPYPALRVEVPANTQIGQLSLVPSSPLQGESYVARGTLYCPMLGDVVSISVVGSDGYVDGYAETIVYPETKTVQLVVPGGGFSVQDIIEVRVTRGGPLVTSRKGVLVFG